MTDLVDLSVCDLHVDSLAIFGDAFSSEFAVEVGEFWRAANLTDLSFDLMERANMAMLAVSGLELGSVRDRISNLEGLEKLLSMPATVFGEIDAEDDFIFTIESIMKLNDLVKKEEINELSCFTSMAAIYADFIHLFIFKFSRAIRESLSEEEDCEPATGEMVDWTLEEFSPSLQSYLDECANRFEAISQLETFWNTQLSPVREFLLETLVFPVGIVTERFWAGKDDFTYIVDLLVEPWELKKLSSLVSEIYVNWRKLRLDGNSYQQAFEMTEKDHVRFYKLLLECRFTDRYYELASSRISAAN